MGQILEYKCPCCGGIIEFDSASQMMKCPYCDTTFDPSALLEMDDALNNPQPDQAEWETPQEQFTDVQRPIFLYTFTGVKGICITSRYTSKASKNFCCIIRFCA